MSLLNIDAFLQEEKQGEEDQQMRQNVGAHVEVEQVFFKRGNLLLLYFCIFCEALVESVSKDESEL